MTHQKLETLLNSLEKITDKYKKDMQLFGYLEMKVKEACLLYLDKHKDCKHGIDKLEMIACSENIDTRDLFLKLVKLRSDRKILEQAIDSFKINISGLQSLIKFGNPI